MIVPTSSEMIAKLENKRVIVDRGYVTPCWEFTGYKLKSGYGQIYYKNRLWYVHIIAYKVYKDDFKESLMTLHKCDNPSCFNPEHLFQGTRSDNVRDCVFKDRYLNQNSNKKFCKNGHEFTEENTYTYPDGHRQCRICKNRLQRRCRIGSIRNTSTT